MPQKNLLLHKPESPVKMCFATIICTKCNKKYAFKATYQGSKK